MAKWFAINVESQQRSICLRSIDSNKLSHDKQLCAFPGFSLESQPFSRPHTFAAHCEHRSCPEKLVFIMSLTPENELHCSVRPIVSKPLHLIQNLVLQQKWADQTVIARRRTKVGSGHRKLLATVQWMARLLCYHTVCQRIRTVHVVAIWTQHS
ncbi:hypothetical protein BAUCODRAFT_381871 [Baudoinia panamericana UAMH 10762]|uniref:Uncharacterized protein n=1 Tax=Baudoinia panamericana (strain UAMH 10762) TaxID=717646 RepID=M2NIB6_BAUPA|nr:uncharacterized protein BAUCODRAFT_381871 [Baudoinia panamericana UAMH 10762]EMC98835.1 hypothetical protein BAUCODRAFT_381871 [Baudoinia panamericana UAMH 10762]